MEKTAKYFKTAIALLALVLFIAFGFIVEQPCNGIDTDSLYCALHPMNEWDYVGTVMCVLMCVFFSDLWVPLVKNEIYMKRGPGLGLQLGIFAFGIIGILIIFFA